MRILHVHEIDGPTTPEPVQTAAPVPQTATVQENERVDTLEKMTASILQKLNAMSERVTALEKAPAAPAAKPEASATPTTPITLDAEAIKKGLMTKMWTYLNDKAA